MEFVETESVFEDFVREKGERKKPEKVDNVERNLGSEKTERSLIRMED